MPNRYTRRRRWLTRLARTLKFSLLLFLLTFGLTAALNTTIPTLEWQRALTGPPALATVNTLVSHQGKLYAGTVGGGVYVYEQGEWQAQSKGLMNGYVNTLLSAGGKLYAGTSGGVFVYEQGQWQVQSKGLMNGYVNTLLSAGGKLYAGTSGGGVFVYEQGQWQVQSKGLMNGYVNTLLSAGGKLYAGTWGGGVFVYEQGEWQAMSEGLTERYFKMLLSAEGKLYAGTGGGVFVYEQGEWQAQSAGLTNINVGMLLSAGGKLYAGTDGGGVFVYEQGEWQAMSEGLTERYFNTLLSAEGKLYAGTDGGGVFVYEQGMWQAQSEGLTSTNVRTLLSAEGKLYAGTGGGVFVYEQGEWQAMSEDLMNSSINTLIGEGGKWYAGTNGGGVYVYEQGEWQAQSKGLMNGYVNTLLSAEGKLYVGTMGGVFVYEQGEWQAMSEGLTSTNVRTLLSEGGKLYAGTLDGGVFVYEQGQWQTQSGGLTSTNVRTLLSVGGKLYAGTDGGGVFVYEQGEWQAQSVGLTSTYVRTLLSAEGKLYAGISGGVFVYEQGQWQAMSEGLTSTNVRTLLSAEGKLYAGTSGGVYMYEQGKWREVKEDLSSGRVNQLWCQQNILYAQASGNFFQQTKARVWQPISVMAMQEYGWIDLGLDWSHWGFVAGKLRNGQWVSGGESGDNIQIQWADELNLQSATLLTYPHDHVCLEMLQADNASMQQDYDYSPRLLTAWGADIRQAKLDRDVLWLPLPLLAWRLWVWKATSWLPYFFIFGIIIGLILEYTNYVRPFRLPLWAIRLTRLPENFADPAALNRAWPEWAAIIRAELFRYGDVHPDDLRALPALFRRYALKRYLAEYGQYEKVEAQGAGLRLLATPTVQAWQRAWAQVSRTMTSMPHLAEAAHAPIEQLTALLAETLGLTNLSAPHHFQAVRAYQVEAPALRLRLPQRFPLIYLADPQPREASIQMLVDAVEVLKESGYFALVIALEPQAAAVNVSQELTQAMQRSAHVQDFIILSGADVLDLLIAREPITQLTRQILRQVDLAVVSPFVINGPVPESMFFGREAEVKQIVDAAGRADFAILGNRKIGKTSLLRRAFKRLNDSGRVQAIWLDCQAVRDSATFLATFGQESKITLPELTPLAFQQAIRAHGRKLVLFIDEAEALLAHEQAQGETLVATWRALAQAELCHFIFAGSTGLAQRLDDPQSAFFNFTQRLTLSYLDETTLGSVLSQPLDTLGLLIDDRDGLLAQVYRLTSGHPNLGQYLGYELIKAANLRQERLILRADLATIEQSGEFMDYFIQTIWGEAPSLARLITLLAPADSFTFSELEAQFQAHNLPFDDEAVTAALRLLRIYAVLQQQGQRYEFIPRAFRRILAEKGNVTRQIKQVAKNL